MKAPRKFATFCLTSGKDFYFRRISLTTGHAPRNPDFAFDPVDSEYGIVLEQECR